MNKKWKFGKKYAIRIEKFVKMCYVIDGWRYF